MRVVLIQQGGFIANAFSDHPDIELLQIDQDVHEEPSEDNEIRAILDMEGNTIHAAIHILADEVNPIAVEHYFRQLRETEAVQETPINYHHVFDLAFKIVTPHSGEQVTMDELLAGIRDRLNYLVLHPNEVIEACGMPSESYVIEESQQYINMYECPICSKSWENQWSCMCNDRCPQCNAEIEPYESREV